MNKQLNGHAPYIHARLISVAGITHIRIPHVTIALQYNKQEIVHITNNCVTNMNGFFVLTGKFITK